jgi:hypothetical protein
MRYEELTTPEAVIAAFEAGRRVERTANQGRHWLPTAQALERDTAGYIRIGWRYRALIEEPEAGSEDACRQRDKNDADALVTAMERHIAGSGIAIPKLCAPPAPDGFTPWYGGECPEDARWWRVTVIYRSGEMATGSAAEKFWRHLNDGTDIIAYRVESVQPKPEPEPAKAAPDYRAILIDVAGNLRRMLDDEFSDCDHERANAVMERINNALSAPAPAPSDVEALAIVGEMDRTAPPKVWLQIDTNGNPSDRSDPIPRDAWGELTWCHESIGGQEVVYIREDIARRLRPQVDEATQDAIDNILNRLDQWGKAYPTSIFREITDEDREWLHRERPGLMDRIAAGMGRHMHKMIAQDIAALTAALNPEQDNAS